MGTGLLAVIAGGAGALVDIVLFGELGVVFGGLFVLGCALSAVRVHVDDLIDVVIMPPLAYAAITIGVSFLRPSGDGAGGGLQNRVIDIGSEMILLAPVLLIAFTVVLVIAVVRGRRAKVARQARERRGPGTVNRRRPPP